MSGFCSRGTYLDRIRDWNLDDRGLRDLDDFCGYLLEMDRLRDEFRLTAEAMAFQTEMRGPRGGHGQSEQKLQSCNHQG